MTAALETLDHAPEPRDLAGIARELHTGFDGMDDMANFIEQAKRQCLVDFLALGFANTAAGELAEIHVGVPRVTASQLGDLT